MMVYYKALFDLDLSDTLRPAMVVYSLDWSYAMVLRLISIG